MVQVQYRPFDTGYCRLVLRLLACFQCGAWLGWWDEAATSEGTEPVAYEQIWAPWRLGYVTGDKKMLKLDQPLELAGADPTCFLCQDVPVTDDRERLVIDRGEHSLTVLNLYPYNNGHLLISPHRHLGRLDELEPAVHAEMTAKIAEMVALLEKVVHPHGFNIGLNLGSVAGAGLPGHLHWHIVPRWNGDTNFMPAIAAINIIPQSLDELWEALTEELRKSP